MFSGGDTARVGQSDSHIEWDDHTSYDGNRSSGSGMDSIMMYYLLQGVMEMLCRIGMWACLMMSN